VIRRQPRQAKRPHAGATKATGMGGNAHASRIAAQAESRAHELALIEAAAAKKKGAAVVKPKRMDQEILQEVAARNGVVYRPPTRSAGCAPAPASATSRATSTPRTPTGFLDGVPYYIPSTVSEDQRDNWARGATSSETFVRYWHDLRRGGRPAPTNPHEAVNVAKATMASIGYGILPGTLRDPKPVPPRWLRDRKGHRKLILKTRRAAKKLRDALNALAQLEDHGLGTRLDCKAAAAFRSAVAEFKVTGKAPPMLEPRVKTPDRRRRFFSDLEQELEWEEEIIRGKAGAPLENARRDEWALTLEQRCGLKGKRLDAVMLALGFQVSDDSEVARKAQLRRRKRMV
jgi:hypothetical protein